ncbi:hypothetical protein ACFB49_39950 [Sphingomonas sp. DBB INV C78]|uniref:molecular chaperone DnaJ n=1 Tax=Sphingomonas sp. DBB INV C78 TaxID=3349434 RepID=UPI0036D2BD48
MTLLAIAVAVLLLWNWKTGRLRQPTRAEIFAGLLGIVGVVLATKGKPLYGLPLLIGAAIVLNRARQQPAVGMPVAEARSLLDLPADADAAAVRAAHRRLIARVHPDTGGSEELARRVNLARDTLLSELNRKRPRAS